MKALYLDLNLKEPGVAGKSRGDHAGPTDVCCHHHLPAGSFMGSSLTTLGTWGLSSLAHIVDV